MKKTKNFRKRDLSVYLVLRFLVILSAALQFLQGNFNNVFVCITALILFTVPSFVNKRLKIELPDLLESIIYLFIFSAQILGEIQNFYGIIPYWDTILHTINGFLFAGIGFALVDILNKNDNVKLYLSPVYVSVVAFCFSMTIGVVWEFFEYAMDENVGFDMQKDMLITNINSVYFDPKADNNVISFNDIETTTVLYNNGEVLIIDGGYIDIGLKDTMSDMIVNAVGAIIFSVIGFYYVKDSEEYKFAKHFIPKKI